MGKELKGLLVPFQGISNLCKASGVWNTSVAKLSRESPGSSLSLILGHKLASRSVLRGRGVEANQSSFLKDFCGLQKKKKK
jgi:hypothetical protein